MDIFKMLIKSFWDAKAYNAAVFLWRWKLLAYFLLLTVISTASASILLSRLVEVFYETQVPQIKQVIKDARVKDWKIHTPDGKDIPLKTPDGKLYAVVTPNYVDATKTKELFFAIEKDRLSFYIGDEEINFLLKDLMPANADFSAVDILPSYNSFLLMGLLPMLFAVYLISNAVYALILSLASYILSATRMPTLGWKRCFKLSVIALTPALCLDILTITIFNFAMPAFFMALLSMFIIFRIMPRLQNPQSPIISTAADSSDVR